MYNVPDRQEMYSAVVDWWLEQANVPTLYVVDSANVGFPQQEASAPDRLRVVAYDQPSTLEAHNFSANESAMGILETLELKIALESFPELRTPTTRVVKLTGKYRVPGLIDALRAAPGAGVVLVQNATIDTAAWSQSMRDNHPCGSLHSETYAMSGEQLARFVDFAVARWRAEPQEAPPGEARAWMEPALAAFVAGEVRAGVGVQRLPRLELPPEFREARHSGDVLEYLPAAGEPL